MIEVAILFEGSIVLLAWALAWVLGVRLGAMATITWSALAWSVACTIPALVVMWIVSELPWAPLRRIRREIGALLEALVPDASLLDLAMVSLLAGVGEEALFRGVLQTVVTGWSSPVWGLIAASVLFGLMHFVTPTYALLAAGIGAYLGWLFLAFDNLVVPVGVHALYDFVALVYLTGESRRGGEPV